MSSPRPSSVYCTAIMATGVMRTSSALLRNARAARLKAERGTLQDWKLGWVTGSEPATSGATVRRSTTELYPPHGRQSGDWMMWCSGDGSVDWTIQSPNQAITRSPDYQIYS